MTMMPATLTATTIKDRENNGWWVIQCDQYPNAFTQVQNLDEAEASVTEVVQLMTDTDPAAFTVTVSQLVAEMNGKADEDQR